MTPEKLEELTEKEKFILSMVPEEFRSVLSTMAYDRGHSAGIEEVVSILEQLVYDLTPAIMKYTVRLKHST